MQEVKKGKIALVLWIIGIIIDIFPMLSSFLKKYLDSGVPISFKNDFIGNVDILFICFSTCFLLFLEMFLLDEIKESIHKKISIGLLVSCFIFLFLYTVAVYNDNWSMRMLNGPAQFINLFTFATTFILGLVYFIPKCFKKS